MNWLHALILGFVQGVTEFFPVSSSAHLKLIKTWLHLPVGEEAIPFDLACHLGTLVAVLIYFRKDLWQLCFAERKKMILYAVALLPLLPAYFLLKPVRLWASQPHFLGASLLITAAFLFFAQRLSKGTSQTPSWKDSLWIGTLQTIALVPGISRSASTITTGLWRGLSATEAVRFSFLLSIPAIAGGAFLEMMKLMQQTPLTFDAVPCAIGFGISAFVGLGVVQMAIPLLEKRIFRPFAWYCLIVSILLIVYL